MDIWDGSYDYINKFLEKFLKTNQFLKRKNKIAKTFKGLKIFIKFSVLVLSETMEIDTLAEFSEVVQMAFAQFCDLILTYVRILG